MDTSGSILVAFAVREEAGPFLEAVKAGGIHTLVTGMGPVRAKDTFLSALERKKTSLVLTCGFAGGLNPAMPSQTVVFDADPELVDLARYLQNAGGVKAQFFCSEQVIADVPGKKRLFAASGADAVEMESGVIRTLCRERSIPSATVRVISDAADEPLPLDFGALMKPDYSMDYLKLASVLARRPGKIPELIRFRKHIGCCAKKLTGVLLKALADRLR